MIEIYVVVDTTKDPYEEVPLSYWSTLRKAQGALARYRRRRMVSERAEVQVVTLDADAFTLRAN